LVVLSRRLSLRERGLLLPILVLAIPPRYGYQYFVLPPLPPSSVSYQAYAPIQDIIKRDHGIRRNPLRKLGGTRGGRQLLPPPLITFILGSIQTIVGVFRWMSSPFPFPLR
jgi:hypothetical protein